MFATRAIFRSLRTPVSRSFSRSLHVQPQRSVAQFAARNLTLAFQHPRLAAPFSTTPQSWVPGSVDDELALKLQSEFEIEIESQDQTEAQLSEDSRLFLNENGFRVIDQPGRAEVELVRQFGNETIRVTFNIVDLKSSEEALDDNSLYDEENPEDDAANARSKPKPEGRAEADETDENYDDVDDVHGFPARVNVSIEKPGRGVLKVETVAQDGMMIIENVFYNAGTDGENEGYSGPAFGNLDEDLAVLFERYLDERGINTSLALFVPEYMEYKEQLEYSKWLQEVKVFVEA